MRASSVNASVNASGSAAMNELGAAPPNLEEIVSAVDRAPTAASYLQAARDVSRLDPELAPVRVALLSSYTIDLLQPYLEVELARHRLGARLYVAPFNTAPQELLDPDSGCARHTPDVVFVAQRLEDVCPSLANEFLSLAPAQVESLIVAVVNQTVSRLEAFRSRSGAAIVVHSFTLPAHPLLGIAEIGATGSQTAAIRDLNGRLGQALKDLPGAHLLDCDRAAATVGYRSWYDDKLWHLARAPLSAAALTELARVQAAFVQAILGRQARCLVLDLDGTLWGGVVGEVGMPGIQLGDRFPGTAYQEFQHLLLALHGRGVLLAINSKNNPEDVAPVFEAHPHTVLRWEHFAARRINWCDKPQNMREIAAELNIGLDALAFFDDNPAERALMRQALPEVRTLEVPQDPIGYAQTLSRSRMFDRLNISDEDRRRGSMYQAQQARRVLQTSTTSLESFLESLEMRAEIEAASPKTLPRVLDLVQKTNQFNLTTRRHTASDLARMAGDPEWGVYALRLGDRFGDQGIVGVAIVRLQATAAQLDTLLLSCRVIGRNVETAFLAFLAGWARSRGALTFEGTFIPTAKNAPASDFFSRHAFSRVRSETDAVGWRLSLDADTVRGPAYITCVAPTGS
ncbi:MAG: HAD-IIIC family phosphatase [Luteitalea sp.]|nr:HAD-IIIC family phosphatase [Luteitalea sp.]